MNVGTVGIKDTKARMNVQLQKTNVHAALMDTIKDIASLGETLRSRRRIKMIKKKDSFSFSMLVIILLTSCVNKT